MSQIKNIKVVYFDLDNTLWDFEKNSYLTMLELYKEEIERYDSNPCFDEFITNYVKINDEMWEEYRQGRVEKDELKFIRFKRAINDRGIFNDELASKIDNEYMKRLAFKPNLVDGAKEILPYLKNKYKLGIITNGFIEEQELKMERTGIREYFQYIIVSEAAGAKKPHPGIFEHALKLSGFQRHEALYIGDDFSVDMLGAKNSGMQGIFFNRKDVNVQNRCEFIEIKNLMELKDII